jgi:DNA replication protein DnaC
MTPPVNQIYIRPTLHIHPNLAAAKEFSDTFDAYHFWSDKKSVGIPDAALGKRNLVIGEPGVGKSLLLTKIQVHLNSIGFSTCLISLRCLRTTISFRSNPARACHPE